MPYPDPKRIANEIIKSISEDPHVEPGQADKTPANEDKPEPQEGDRDGESHSG